MPTSGASNTVGGQASAGSVGSVASNLGNPTPSSSMAWAANLPSPSPSRLPSSTPAAAAAAPEMSPGAPHPPPPLSTIATPSRLSTNNNPAATLAAGAVSSTVAGERGAIGPAAGVVVGGEGGWGQPQSASEGLPESLPLTGLTFEGVFSPTQVSCLRPYLAVRLYMMCVIRSFLSFSTYIIRSLPWSLLLLPPARPPTLIHSPIVVRSHTSAIMHLCRTEPRSVKS